MCLFEQKKICYYESRKTFLYTFRKMQNTEKIVKRVVKDVKEGDIILMHDIFETSVQAAFQIIDTLEKENYEFVTVDELLWE